MFKNGKYIDVIYMDILEGEFIAGNARGENFNEAK